MEVLEHEVLHVVLDHIRRMGNRHPFLWNLATDAVIDIIQKNPDIDKVPSAEEIYKELEKEGENHQETSSNGSGNDSGENQNNVSSGSSSTGSDSDNIYGIGGVERNPSLSEEKVKEKITRAATMASQIQTNKSIGTLPQAIQALLEEYLAPPKVKWQELLTAYLTEKTQNQFSWSRPSRKSPPGVYLPGRVKQYNSVRAILALDVSGSISNLQLNEFFNECKHILKLYDVEGFVVQFDADIQHVQELDDNSSLEIKRYGCGGTDFVPVCQFASKEDDVSLLIIFTDLMGTFPPKPPVGVDVLWIVSENKSPHAPFGRIIKM